MTLGEVVKNYRTEHGLSLRDFSRMAGMSNGYISMLEKNEHPKTKKPIVPSIEKVKNIASVMGLSLDSLLEMLDSEYPISIASDSRNPVEDNLISLFRILDTAGKNKLIERANELIELGYVENYGNK